MTSATKPEVQHQIVGAMDADRRLDNYLGSVLKHVPKSMIYRIIRSGEVRINGGRAKASSKLQAGDDVRIPPVRLDSIAPRELAGAQVAAIDAQILFENDAVLVLNKPHGLAVHGGTGLSFGAIDLVRAARPGAVRVDLVHRLDRDTSGCLLFAKDQRTLRRLNRELAEQQMEKRYLALLAGILPQAEILIDRALDVEGHAGPERRTVTVETGQRAATHFARLSQYQNCCLVEATLHTGRTHQIRVHAQHLGQPVAGDPKYGDVAFNNAMAALGLKRLFLHAARLEFTLDSRIRVEAPLPPDLQRLLTRLTPI